MGTGESMRELRKNVSRWGWFIICLRAVCLSPWALQRCFGLNCAVRVDAGWITALGLASPLLSFIMVLWFGRPECDHLSASQEVMPNKGKGLRAVTSSIQQLLRGEWTNQERNELENSHHKNTVFYQRHSLCCVLTCSEHEVLTEFHVLLIIPYLNSANGRHQLFSWLVEKRF